MILTAPVAAHKIGRAGYRRGAPLYEGTICDEARGHLPRDEVVQFVRLDNAETELYCDTQESLSI